jgi:hypothetical protein
VEHGGKIVVERRPYYFSCPSCGNQLDFYGLDVRGDGGVGCLIFFLGGFIPYLIFAGANRRKVQCGLCRTIFQQPALPVGSWHNRVVVMWVLAVSVIVGWLVAVELAGRALQEHPLVEAVNNVFVLLITDYFVHALWGVGGLLALSILVSCVSNVRHRNALSKEWRLDVPYYS